MAYFHISPGTPSLTLPSSRRGQFSFTVTNNLGRPTRIQATVLPEAGTRPEWLSIEPPAERDLTSTETQTFIVQVQVPNDVPTGEQRFKLLVASVARPDDEYDTSPAVAFTIPAPAVETRAFPWWIVIVAGAVVVIGLGGFFLFRALRGPGLGQPCDPAKANCRGGLTCPGRDGGTPDAGTSVCLLPLGSSGCKNNSDCAAGVCNSSGTCQQPPPGANCAADANCPPTQKCVDVRPGVKTCLLRGGQPCSQNSVCASWCISAKQQCAPENGACTNSSECPSADFECAGGFCKVSLGKPCQQHGDCTSNNCQGGTCQPCTAVCDIRFSYCQGNQCVSRFILSIPNYQMLPMKPQHWKAQ